MKNFKFQVYTTDWDGVKGIYDVCSITLMNELEGTLSIVFTNSSGDIEKCFVRKEDLRQYTGLRDKNGKDIYLGDKVRWTKLQYTDCSMTEVEGTEITEGVVDWMDTTLVLKKDGHAFFLWPTAIDEPNELEIIGNIYDLEQIQTK